MTKLFRGGGTIANTLNAVPERIDKMLTDNYKKIATGTFNLNFSISSSNTNRLVLIKKDSSNSSWDYYKLKDGIKIPLNLDFKPSLFYITIPTLYPGTRHPDERYSILCNKVHYETLLEGEHNLGLADKLSEGRGYIENLTEKEAIINLNLANTHMDDYPFRMLGNCEWVAIE